MSTKLNVSVGMFRAIHTKYIGPSNRRGSRIKAFDEAGNSVTIRYDDDLGHCGEPIEPNRGGQCYGCGQQERREDAIQEEEI